MPSLALIAGESVCMCVKAEGDRSLLSTHRVRGREREGRKRLSLKSTAFYYATRVVIVIVIP